MKIFAFILAIFFAFLTAVPCSDAFSADENLETQVHKAHDGNSTDFCSPFCKCACCGAQLNVAKFQILSFISLTPNPFAKISTLHSTLALDILFGIWQPPKIC